MVPPIAREDGVTNAMQQFAAIFNFGEMVLADVKNVTNRKLAIRSQEQKVEGRWIGKTTNNA
eukprot:502609-Amphidinium_carterae.1